LKRREGKKNKRINLRAKDRSKNPNSKPIPKPMRTTGLAIRIRWKYLREVPIPEEWEIYLWDEESTAPLEKLIVRVLTFGDYEDIKRLYSLYPDETYDIAFRYPDIKRGVRFWMKVWHDKGKD